MMQFVREIPESLIVQKNITDLEQFGFTLVWTADSVLVYADVLDTRLQSIDVQRAA